MPSCFCWRATSNNAAKLTNDTVVATTMSNMGLEIALRESGITMLRAPVGDKYVLEQMQKSGAVLGGEQSGHIILSREATTGDGLLTAIRVLGIVAASGRSLAELASGLKVFPQTIKNIRVKEKRPLDQLPQVMTAIEQAERELNGNGRVNVRYSGTEALARVMVEAETEEIRPADCRPYCGGPGIRHRTGCAFCPLNWHLRQKKRLPPKVVILVLILLAAFAFIPMLRSALRSGVGIASGGSLRSGLRVCGGHAAADVLCAGALRLLSFLRPYLRAWHINRIRNGRYMKDVIRRGQHRGPQE